MLSPTVLDALASKDSYTLLKFDKHIRAGRSRLNRTQMYIVMLCRMMKHGLLIDYTEGTVRLPESLVVLMQCRSTENKNQTSRAIGNAHNSDRGNIR